MPASALAAVAAGSWVNSIGGHLASVNRQRRRRQGEFVLHDARPGAPDANRTVTRTVTGAATVTKWIAQAARLEAAIRY